MYIPVTDNPITSAETNEAHRRMKKGGYDFPLQCLELLMYGLSSLLTLLMDITFAGTHPIQLCLSLIPKVDNYRLPDNHRCIQMQRLLSN